MDLIAEAIARQDSAGSGPKVIDAADDLVSQRGYAMAFAGCLPLAAAVLAWCQEHMDIVGEHAPLVEDLRIAIATKGPLGSTLLALWCEVPETAFIEPVSAKAKG